MKTYANSSQYKLFFRLLKECNNNALETFVYFSKEEHKKPIITCPPSQFLHAAFVWSSTPQGHNFWKKIYTIISIQEQFINSIS